MKRPGKLMLEDAYGLLKPCSRYFVASIRKLSQQ